MRTLCGMILSFMKTLVKHVHYSFGSQRDDRKGRDHPDAELPHIVFPLVNAVDRLIVTPPGVTPPELGLIGVPESDADRKRRRQRAREQHHRAAHRAR